MNAKTVTILFRIAIVLTIFSAIAIFMSYAVSGDRKQLLKLSAPATVIMIIAFVKRRKKNIK